MNPSSSPRPSHGEPKGEPEERTAFDDAYEAALAAGGSSATQRASAQAPEPPVRDVAQRAAARASELAAQREAEREALAEELEERRRLARGRAVQNVRKGRGTKVLLGLAVVFVGVLGAIQYQREKLRQWQWASIPMPEDRVARVPEKWDPPTLAKRLATTGKIRDSSTFLQAARAIGLEEVLPGGYELPAKAGPDELVRLFKAGPTMAKVTFPEGFTCQRIAERLEARGFKNAPQLLKLAYPSANPNTPSPTEGRWFPDTYLMSKNATAQVLAARLSERFNEIFVQLPSGYPKVDGKALTRNELVTLASIVERETSVESERAVVAGVLLNRLRQNMRLECDATIQYARERAKAAGQLGEGHKSRLSYRDIDAVKDSPYNSYERKGLPPGPICNPGRAALEAAARPKSSKYLFYVMSPAQGKHRFSATYEQFLRDKALYKAELAAQKN